MFQALNADDPRAPVPSPIMDSELKNSDESTIVESSSLENLSKTAQWDSDMDMPTVIVQTSIGDTPAPTSTVASRTRSHDGERVVPPLPKFMMDDLMNNIEAEMQRAREQNRRRDQNLNDTEEEIQEGVAR